MFVKQCFAKFWHQLNKKPIFLILFSFLIWRLFLFFISYFSDAFLSYQPSFPYYDELLPTFSMPRWIFSFANFDGVHYLTIANKGYKGAELIQAFFPVYPLLTRLLNFLVNNFLISGLLIANFSFIVCLYFGYKLTKLDFGTKTANWWLLILLTFPTSFYFGALYSESLFLAITFACLWYIRHEKNTISSILNGLLSGVRVLGVVLLPTLYLEWIKKQPNFNKLSIIEKIKKMWFFIFSFFGLIVFMFYLQKNYNDFLYFFHVQAEFGAGRQESIILLPQVIFRYIKILITVHPINWKYFSYVQDLVMSLLSLAIMAFWFLQKNKDKFRLSYLCYAIPVLIVPTLTGTFSSMPRYVLICFPIFMWLAEKLKKANYLMRIIYFIVSIMLLIINTTLFIQGYWVA